MTPAGRDSALFWSDASVLTDRVQKAAAALIAVRQVLERRPPLSEAETRFLASVTRAARSKPADFGRIWSDPCAYYWVRMAYRLVAASETGEPLDALALAYCRAIDSSDVRCAFDHHLRDFDRFVVGLCVVEGSELSLQEPLPITCPFAIPGTRYSIEGVGEAQLLGLHAGDLQLEVAGRRLPLPLRSGASAGPLSIAECPMTRVAGCEIRLQPATFSGLHGLDFVEPVLQAGPAFQERHHGLVEQALELVERHAPETFGQIRDGVEVIGLKPLRSGGYTNIAHSDLPGAFVAAVIENAWELADTFIHEFHHNRLFALEEQGPFFDASGPDSVLDMRFYSPWRDDPRALHGILHGAYVFVPVWGFWRSVASSGAAPPEVAAYARERLARIHLQLELAVHQLASQASLSDLGRRLLAELRRCVDAMRPQMQPLNAPPTLPAMKCEEDGRLVEAAGDGGGSVLEAVRDHAARFAPLDQRASLLAHPTLS